MGKTYEVWCGRRLVALRNTRRPAWEAAYEFLRSEGCKADEIVRLSGGAVAWRGTIYRAIAVGSNDSAPEHVRGWSEALS
jgi:hypothetical protein